jgi:hypothetical protein
MIRNKIPTPYVNRVHEMPAHMSGTASYAFVLRKLGDQVINWFLREDPPASRVDLVPGSLKAVDSNKTIWYARVLTTVFFPVTGAKQHISRISFHVDTRNNIINNKLTFLT